MGDLRGDPRGDPRGNPRGNPEGDPEYGRLRWRCRRGMKELDVVLLNYLERHYAAADTAERRAFADLLELQDPLLFAYVSGREAPADPLTAAIVAKLTADP